MNNKVICCCNNVTIEDVEKQIENGVKTFEELQSITKIGTGCPPCKEENEALFQKLITEKSR